MSISSKIEDADVMTGNDWYNRFREYARDASDLIALTRDGVWRIEQLPKLLELNYPDVEPDTATAEDHQHRDHLEKAQRAAVRAKSMRESDFALLHAHSLMGLWGALESAVEDVVTTRLVENDQLLAGEAFGKLKLPASVLVLPPWDRARSIVFALQKDQGSESTFGLGQFEKILKPVGLGGSYVPRVHKALILAQQYRHLVAHRGGRADQKFIDSCPQVKVSLGERVSLSRTDFDEITTAMAVFTLSVMNRLLVANGQEPSSRLRDSGKIAGDWFNAEPKH